MVSFVVVRLERLVPGDRDNEREGKSGLYAGMDPISDIVKRKHIRSKGWIGRRLQGAARRA